MDLVKEAKRISRSLFLKRRLTPTVIKSKRYKKQKHPEFVEIGDKVVRIKGRI